jgi:5-methylcytosine-specific restriction endonuclease McrA
MPKKKKQKIKRKNPKKKTKASTKQRTSKKVGVINEKKLGLYVNKLYRGELSRYKKKLQQNSGYSLLTFTTEERKIKREPISKAQEKAVLDKYGEKCVICGKPYDKDDFEIHHINGDRSNTRTQNLVPMCHRCHRKVTTLARAKLKDYKVEQNRKNLKVFLTSSINHQNLNGKLYIINK